MCVDEPPLGILLIYLLSELASIPDEDYWNAP
jgi:hypothetical protein